MARSRRARRPLQRGFIRCYGLFWASEEVTWAPGRGRAGQFRLLGRVGTNLPGVSVCDFRDQRGIYVLYDDYGPYYVGLSRDRPIGERLRTHWGYDRHAGNWDRFSWFGFRRVLVSCLSDGTRALGKAPRKLLTETHWTIGDIEALLIQSLGTQHRGNANEMKFAAAKPWLQVMRHEVDDYLSKVER